MEYCKGQKREDDKKNDDLEQSIKDNLVLQNLKAGMAVFLFIKTFILFQAKNID